jgi:alpha-1,3-mannosylglycoprotein beta-1,4-N-acetylglucosaminyltransferase A/B
VPNFNTAIVYIKFKLLDEVHIEKIVQSLNESFFKDINHGHIDILIPDPDFYPNFDYIKIDDHIFNDSADRIKWRIKQNYDYSYLMNYCSYRGDYYLQVNLIQLKKNVYSIFQSKNKL